MNELKPMRVQLSRRKGWKMPPNTVKVDRTTKWGNPFRVGGYFMVGDPIGGRFRMSWCEELVEPHEDQRFTLVASPAIAVDMFNRLVAAGNYPLDELRGKNLACWCSLDSPCHADVLLRIANE